MFNWFRRSRSQSAPMIGLGEALPIPKGWTIPSDALVLLSGRPPRRTLEPVRVTVPYEPRAEIRRARRPQPPKRVEPGSEPPPRVTVLLP